MPDTGGNHGGSGTDGDPGNTPAPAPGPKNPETDPSKIAALRVQQYVAPEKGKTIGTAGRTVATLHKSDMKDSKPTLKTIRDMLKAMLPKDALLDQNFCYADGSMAKDDLTLDQYSLVLNEDIAPTKVTETILIEPVPQPIVKPPEPPTATGILTGGAFLIHAFQWQIGANGQSLIDKGLIHSKSLANVDMKTLKLSGLRKMITSMSPIPKIHYFCSSTGTTVEDESLLFTDYLALSPVQPSDKDLTETTSDSSAAVDDSTKPDSKTTSEPAKSTKPAAVQVYYKKNSVLNNPTKLEMPENLKALNSKLSDETKTQLKLDDFKSQEDQWKELFPTDMITGSDINARTAQSLTDLEWYEVLTNCSVFYGWFVDRDSNRIVRAPKPAFRLKKPASSTSAVATSDFEAPSSATQPDASSSVKPPVSDTHPTNNPATNPGTTGSGTSGSGTAGSGTAGSGTAGSDASGHTPDNPPIPDSTGNAPAPDPSGSVPDSGASAPPAAGDSSVLPQSTKPPLGIPNYQVQDESSIEITACQHEFEDSMAHNDFSASTVEGSMTGGFGGYSVSVTASHSESHSSSIKTSSQTLTKTIIARYLFPRCELSVFPGDVEPTPELVSAIERVRKTRNLRDLSKIHSEFGHVFCQRLTLGGRLLSSKTILSTDNRSDEQQKSEFKTAVGVAVSTPYGGASVTSTQSGGSSDDKAKVDIKKSESDVWTAQGGNTILANNVVAWAPTVADYRLWRVINRDSVVSLADAIAGMDGYAQVKAWFVQAVPDVAKFIQLDPSRQTTARFKLTSPLNNLSLHHPDNKDVFSNSRFPNSLAVPAEYPNAEAFYYLGHDGTTNGVQPQKLYVDTTGVNDWFWGGLHEHTVEIDRMLFTPATWQAPSIIGYRDSQVGDSTYGALYTPEYTHTEWTITAPFTDALTHGSLIVLQNQIYTDPDLATTPPPATTTPSTLPVANAPTPSGPHMAVFRNQQGVFLPYMSQDTTPQYWRILKKSGGDTGQHLQGGDEIRLAWAFADQVTGFRDFYQDAFGRKRSQCPPELVNLVLYLKLPWPRFENYQTVSQRGLNTMFMHQTPGTGDTQITMYTHMAEDPSTLTLVEASMGNASGLPHVYVAQDVSFRIDPVDNDGYGESYDYMLRGLVQGRDSKKITEHYQYGNDWSMYIAKSFYI